MGIRVEETATDYIFKLPKGLLSPEDAHFLFHSIEYRVAGMGSQATEQNVEELVELSKGAGVRANRDWLKDVPGFEALQ